MNYDSALDTYINEANELLTEMEEGLLQMEQGENKPENLNSIFRAAHTIKGSAGLFGLEGIVSFTHGVESLLDGLRAGELLTSADLNASLLECHDHLKALVGQIENQGSPEEQDSLKLRGETLTARLKAFGAKVQEKSPLPPTPPQVPAQQTSPSEGEVSNGAWHLSLRFGRNSLKDGMDPLSFIRYLSTLGQILQIQTLDDGLPALEALDPENCYLGFEIAFQGEVDKQTLEEVFGFVRADSQIHILPPRSRISEYTKLIEELPEENLRLGEILVRCGSLTRRELEEALQIQTEKQAQSINSPLGDILVAETGVSLQPLVDAALGKQAQVQENKSKEAHLIRVDAEKLDLLINLIGELVIAGAGASLRAQNTRDADLIESVSTLADLVEEARDAALKLRMVQIGATFNKFQRVVRDMSKELGKEIDLVITGAETELDKTVVEKIGDPLMHLVRNAIDHGVESASQRQKSGKPSKGTLKLNAYHDSGSIVIEVSDDGAGLNRGKILKKAIAQGLVQEGQNLSETEINHLIFAPGFSTAEAVTNLSGRGVGMDVVKRNISALRGTVDLESLPGQGTTCRIRLPLTLAIIDGFQVAVGDFSYVIPLEMVQECVELSEAKNRLQGNRQYLNLRGLVLPTIQLRDLFQVKGTPPRRASVVVVQSGGNKAGLVVDRLVGELQTVIKPLGRLFTQVQGIGGSTILGNGEVALILDIPGLVQKVTSTENRSLQAAV